MRLAHKLAIVTGASSGMGAATARLFAREGAKVILTDVLEAEGHEVTQSILSAGGEARFLRHDVASEADWQAAVAAALEAHAAIDILINNAGVSGSDPDRLSMPSLGHVVRPLAGESARRAQRSPAGIALARMLVMGALPLNRRCPKRRE